MAALPFIFLTNELHVISTLTLQSSQHPPSIQISKRFYIPHIEEMKAEFQGVKAMGAPTAEEWLKGLDGRGKERRNDAARWERWDASGGITRMIELGTNELLIENAVVNPSAKLLPNPSTTSGNGDQLKPVLSSTMLQQAQYLLNAVANLPKPIHTTFGKLANPNPSPSSNTGGGSHDTDLFDFSASNPPPLRYNTPSQNGFQPFVAPAAHQSKHTRTKDEVAMLKAARRSEIERRCLLLDPPLTAPILAHMASFQAAIQIIQPLTDSAWEVLKPRLLSQREEAQQRENDRLAQTRVAQERFDERKYQDLQAKTDPKDLIDMEWDDIQAPLRARIGGFADEIIRDGWSGGEKVSYESSPLFAAEVLIYVRKRFYAEVAKDEAAIRATGKEPELDPPNGPYTRKLILENMKWVFDTKVKPHTEQYRKELFLCSACNYASKYYGFEGVIQHYAAKHTITLSVGSIVVHWKSEWPEDPPFSPDPGVTNINSYYPTAPGTTVSSYPITGQAISHNHNYGGYQTAPVPGTMQAPTQVAYQQPPAPYYGQPQYGEQYPGHQNGQYHPQIQTYPASTQPYSAPQYSNGPPAMTAPGYHDRNQDFGQQSYGGHYQQQPRSTYTSTYPTNSYPATAPETATLQGGYTQPESQYGVNYQQPAVYAPPSVSQVPQKTSEYMGQLQDLAGNARNVWNAIGGMKEVPGSLKVYTVIHHVLESFRASFQSDPPLSMLVDGLSNNKDMRPVRNVNGLLCRACTLGMAGSTSKLQKKHYSFPQLVNHFLSIHEQAVAQNYGHVPDWKTDMVDLPDMSKLRSIVKTTGMDEFKLKFFTGALPDLVSKKKRNKKNFQNGSNGYHANSMDQNGQMELAASEDNHEKYYNLGSGAKPSDSGSTAHDSGEYDPRRPQNLDVAPRAHPRASQYPEQDGQVYERPDGQHYEQNPSRTRTVDKYGRIFFENDQPADIDRSIRYHDPDLVQSRARLEPLSLEYEERRPASNHRLANAQSYQENGREVPPAFAPVNNTTIQRKSISEVVAQISRQAQQVSQQQSVKQEKAGSEDGELPVDNVSKSDEASRAAERFLENFNPGEPVGQSITRNPQDSQQRRDEIERTASRQVYRDPVELHRQPREYYEEDQRLGAGSRPILDDGLQGGYIIREPIRAYAYDERNIGLAPERQILRDRSPELVDRRYKLNDVVYRGERQGSNAMHRTPSGRYARYESVRLENDRTRSRSPVYVQAGGQSVQYRERSPTVYPHAQPLRQEPMYHPRSPIQYLDEPAYEQPARRVYIDEPRPGEPQYAEEFELIRVSDPNGDYMVRRPVRRQVERIYYEDDGYTRQPVYERGLTAARAEPAFEGEGEYDPRHPAAMTAPVRYQ